MSHEELTEEEIKEYTKFRVRNSTYETGLTRDERYILNKIHSEYLEKLDNKLNK